MHWEYVCWVHCPVGGKTPQTFSCLWRFNAVWVAKYILQILQRRTDNVPFVLGQNKSNGTGSDTGDWSCINLAKASVQGRDFHWPPSVLWSANCIPNLVLTVFISPGNVLVIESKLDLSLLQHVRSSHLTICRRHWLVWMWFLIHNSDGYAAIAESCPLPGTIYSVTTGCVSIIASDQTSPRSLLVRW